MCWSAAIRLRWITHRAPCKWSSSMTAAGSRCARSTPTTIRTTGSAPRPSCKSTPPRDRSSPACSMSIPTRKTCTSISTRSKRRSTRWKPTRSARARRRWTSSTPACGDCLSCRGRLPDAYGDLLRHDGRRERIVLGIAQHELKRVRPGRKLEQRFGLPCPEMQMRLVLQDRLLGIDGVVDVDQQMMVTGVLILVAGMGHSHVAQAEPDPESAADLLPVMRGDEIELCVFGACLALREGCRRQQCERRRQRDATKDLHQPTPPLKD